MWNLNHGPPPTYCFKGKNLNIFFKGSEFFEDVHVKNTIEMIKYLEKDKSIFGMLLFHPTSGIILDTNLRIRKK